MKNRLEHISRIIEDSRAVMESGILSGFNNLDDMFGKFKSGNLIVIASRPGMGKTDFSLAIALNAVKVSGKSVVIFTLDKSKQQIALELQALEPEISLYDIYINDSATSVGQMKKALTEIKNPCLVIIDYFQLFSTEEYTQKRKSAYKCIARDIKQMAAELYVPIIVISQVSRSCETRSQKRPRHSDLSKATYGAFDNYSDAIVFLYRDSYYNIECIDTDKIECIVVKNRNGEVGTVTLHWDSESLSFKNIC